MYDNDSKGIPYMAGFFLLIAFVIAGSLVASQLSEFVWESMTGKPFEVLTNGTAGPEDGNASKLVQFISAVAGFFIPTLLTAIVLHRKPFKLLGFTGGARLNQVGLTILILGSSLLVSASLSYITRVMPWPETWQTWFDGLEQDYGQQIAGIIRLNSTADYIVSLLVLGFVPALCEETVFRGGLQNFLARGTNSPWIAIIVVSILFSLAHASFYLFLSRFFLGMSLGAIFYYSGKLWLSILAHFLNNAITITVLFVYTQQGKSMEEAMRQGGGSVWGILALPVVIVLFLTLRKASFANRRVI